MADRRLVMDNGWFFMVHRVFLSVAPWQQTFALTAPVQTSASSVLSVVKRATMKRGLTGPVLRRGGTLELNSATRRRTGDPKMTRTLIPGSHL